MQSIRGYTHWMLVFFILFALLLANETGYANPPCMKAPWPGGITYPCNQGNFSPISHNIPFTFYAWDFDLPMGSHVVAVADGTVSHVGNRGTDGYGQQIRIKHPNGSYSLYAHLSSYCVLIGQPVVQGQIIGYSGNTGNSTGPHLHFSIIDKINYSLPSRFSDIGIPVTDQYYTSQNFPQNYPQRK